MGIINKLRNSIIVFEEETNIHGIVHVVYKPSSFLKSEYFREIKVWSCFWHFSFYLSTKISYTKMPRISLCPQGRQLSGHRNQMEDSATCLLSRSWLTEQLSAQSPKSEPPPGSAAAHTATAFIWSSSSFPWTAI